MIERFNHKPWKKRIAKAKTPEQEASIRLEWAAAQTAFYAELTAGETLPAPPDGEAEALDAAMRLYGAPAAADAGRMGRVAASIPTPIEIRLPRVNIITEEERR